MDRDPPEPQPFDPASSDAPPLPDAPASGGFVLLVAASGSDDGDWAERSAASLAAGWARRGRRILLADLSLVRPGLHRVLGVENREGVSDTFLFGSSIQRVAQPVREHGFLFVPAGTATARPDAVTGSPRWGAVVEGCARVQATMVVFLPSDLPGGETLLTRASDVVLLTDRRATGIAALQAGLGDRLRAVLVPPATDHGAGRNGAGGSGATEPASPEAPAAAASWGAEPAAAEPAWSSEAAVPAFDEALPTFDDAPLPTLDDAPLPTFAVEQTLETEGVGGSPTSDEPETSFSMEASPPSFEVEAPPPAAEEDALSFVSEEAAPAFDVHESEPTSAVEASEPALEAPPSFAIEEAMPAAAADADASSIEPPAAPVFGEIELAGLPGVAGGGEQGTDSFAGMDLDLGALPEGGAHVEEVPSFSGELAFLEPEPAPATPEVVPMANSSWAPSPSAPAETMSATAADLRATDLPTREPDDSPARERTKPTPRPGTRPAARAESAPARSNSGRLTVALALLVVGTVAAAWFRVIEVPGLSGLFADLAPPASATPAPTSSVAAAPPEIAESRAYGLSLTLDAFTDPAIARLQASSLNEQRPDMLFVVAPVQLNGRVYHRLLAGPAADSAAAEELRATLAGVLTRENPRSWVVRPTTLAFNMGDREDLAGAALRVAELSRVDIPAYVLELPGRSASGARTPRYRVYAGAYADEQEGTYLRNVLVSKGFPDARLVPRIGRHPQ